MAEAARAQRNALKISYFGPKARQKLSDTFQSHPARSAACEPPPSERSQSATIALALLAAPARSLGPSQLVLVENRIPGGDHLFQDYVHVFLAIILVPKHKELSVLRVRERQQ